MQEVQTFIRLRAPPTRARTDFMLGLMRRRVRRCEWDTLMPKPGPLPQMSHTEATGFSISGGGRHRPVHCSAVEDSRAARVRPKLTRAIVASPRWNAVWRQLNR